MADKSFYDIKGLGELPSENEPTHSAPAHQPPRPFKIKNQKKQTNWKQLGLIAAIILVIVVLGGGGYWYAKHHKKTPAKTSSTTTGSSVQPTTTSTSSTVQYVSNGSDLNLSFSYPSDWSVTPASNNNSSDQTITLTSPLSSIATADGTTETGRVVLTIRPGSATVSELTANSPVESVASTQIAYASPTASQYQYPYISFFHFSTGSKASGAFEEVMITGTSQFTQGETLSTTSIGDLDPVIAASFTKCLTSSCSGSDAAPLSINSAIWQNNALCEQVLAIFQSMKLN